MHMLGGVNVKAIILNQTLRYYYMQEIVQHWPCLTEENVMVEITEILDVNCSLLGSFPVGVSPSVLKAITVMAGKNMPNPVCPFFTRSVFMLDVGLQFSSRFARLDIPGGRMQLYLCLNTNLT